MTRVAWLENFFYASTFVRYCGLVGSVMAVLTATRVMASSSAVRVVVPQSHVNSINTVLLLDSTVTTKFPCSSDVVKEATLFPFGRCLACN